jgi:DNA-binding transcriptional regulator YiaG
MPGTGRRMTQEDLARILHVSLNAVRAYEQDLRLPLNAIRESLLVIWPDFFLT